MSRGQSEKTYFKKNGICSHVCGTVKFRSAVNVLSQLFMYMPQQSSTMLNWEEKTKEQFYLGHKHNTS